MGAVIGGAGVGGGTWGQGLRVGGLSSPCCHPLGQGTCVLFFFFLCVFLRRS